MNDTLFDMPDNLTPLAAWKRQHGVETMQGEDEEWLATIGDADRGTGHSELAACARAAASAGIAAPPQHEV